VVAASRREKRGSIGEARWGTGKVSRKMHTDLVEYSLRMPQVEKGWAVASVLFTRKGFTPAAREAAGELRARLVDLAELEKDLVAAASRS